MFVHHFLYGCLWVKTQGQFLLCLMALCLLPCAGPVQAQEPDKDRPEEMIGQQTATEDDTHEAARPVTSVIACKLGSSKVRDTYLTPLRYDGPSVAIQYERWRRMRGLKWTNQQILNATMSQGTDRGKDSDMWAGRFGYRYAMHRTVCASLHALPTPGDWALMAGPYASGELGYDYNLKLVSSNNPATVRACVNLGVSLAGMAHYRLNRQPCVVALQMQLPLAGAALMPEYGASYYETFYLEHTGNDMHLTSLHNQQDLFVQLTTDIPLSVIPWFRKLDTTIRLGAAYRIETMKLNHITTRFSSMEFVIGWVYQYLPISRRRAPMVRGDYLPAF